MSKRSRAGVSAGGYTGSPPTTSPLSRECPRCGAPSGWGCRMHIPAAGYWKPIKTIHTERRTKRGPYGPRAAVQAGERGERQ